MASCQPADENFTRALHLTTVLIAAGIGVLELLSDAMMIVLEEQQEEDKKEEQEVSKKEYEEAGGYFPMAGDCLCIILRPYLPHHWFD